MKRIENRLTKLEQAHLANNFVRLLDDLSLWTEEHIEGLARWCESAGDVRRW